MEHTRDFFCFLNSATACFAVDVANFHADIYLRAKLSG